jgi:hypothetical protein
VVCPPHARQEATDRDTDQESEHRVDQTLPEGGGGTEEPMRKVSEQQAHEPDAHQRAAVLQSISERHSKVSLPAQSVQRYQIISATLTTAMETPPASRSQLQK